MRNNSIYLTEVSIGAFKPFRFNNDQSLSFHDGPSAVILSGHNGLGKSSFLEAIQWVLTGTTFRLLSDPAKTEAHVKHIPNAPNLPARARRPVSPSVALSFSDGSARPTRFQRESNNAPDPRYVFDFLSAVRAPTQDSLGGSHLLRRLGLTHFLAQRSNLRIADADSSNLHKTILELADIAAYERAATAIYGSGAEKAGRSFSKQITDLDEQKQDIKDFQERLKAARETEDLAGISSSEFRRTFNKAFKDSMEPLADMSISKLRGSRLPNPISNAVEGAELAGRSQEILSELETALLWFRSQSEELAGLHTEWSELSDQLGPETAALSLDAAEQRRSRLSKETVDAAQRFKDLETLRRRVVEQDEIAASLESQKTILNSELEEARVKTAKALEASKKRAEETAAVRAQQQSCKVRIESLREIVRRKKAIAGLEADLEKLPKMEEIETKLAASLGALDLARQKDQTAKQDLETMEERLSDARAVLGRLEQPLSVLLNEVAEGQVECAFCGHAHESSEALTLHARKILDDETQLLSREIDQVKAARRERDQARAAVRAAKSDVFEVTELQDRITELSGELDAAKDEVQMVATALGLTGTEWEDIETAQEKLNAQLQDLSFQVAQHSDNQSGELDVDEATRAYEDAIKTYAETRDSVDALLRRRETITQELEIGASSFPDTEITVPGLEFALSQARDSVETHRQNRNSFDEDLAHIRRREQVASQWRERVSSSMEPSLDMLKELKHCLELLAASIDRLVSLRKDLIKKLKAAQEENNRELLIKELHEAYASFEWDTPEEPSELEAWEQALKTFAKEVQKKRKEIAEAKQLANHVSTHLKKKGKQAKDTFLTTAFQTLFNKQLTALSPHKDLTVDWETSRNKALLKSRGLDVTSSLSEGEISAVSLSAMLAAARHCAWSRWPALLLDDPIQHEDVIHQAAFADAMRSLIKESGFQIFITTHDHNKADYFRRKMMPFEIPCQHVRFMKEGDTHTFQVSK